MRKTNLARLLARFHDPPAAHVVFQRPIFDRPGFALSVAIYARRNAACFRSAAMLAHVGPWDNASAFHIDGDLRGR